MLIYDRMSISESKRSRTPQGFLEIKDNILARPGIMEYRAGELELTDRDAASVVRVYRSPEVLFNKGSMDTLKLAPMTSTHPNKRVDPVTAKDVAVGISKEDIRPDNGVLVGSLLIMDQKAIDDVESRKREQISLGYAADFEVIAGTDPEGNPFDVKMTGYTGNHIALVERGRCGPIARISDAQNTNPKEEFRMDLTQHVVDSVPYELTAQGIKLLEKATAAHDALTAKHDALVADAASQATELKTEHQSTVDALQAKLDDAESKILSESDFDDALTKRMTFLDSVKKLMGEDFDVAGKSEAEIKAAIVGDCRKVDVSDKSAEYIQASFEILVEDSAKQTNGYTKQLGDHADTTTVEVADDKRSFSDKARQARIDKNKERFGSK